MATVVFVGLSGTFFETLYRFPTYSPRLVDLLYAVPLALVGGAVGLLFMASLGRLRKLLQPLKSHVVLRAVLGGLGMGIIGALLPLTLFSGEKETSELIQNATEIGVVMLLVLGIAKLFATSLLLTTGWKGGYIFPIMFTGVALGLAVNSGIPQHPGCGHCRGDDGGRVRRRIEGASVCGVLYDPPGAEGDRGRDRRRRGGERPADRAVDVARRRRAAALAQAVAETAPPTKLRSTRMRTRTVGRAAARYRWDRLKVSFWFAPAVMAVVAVLLAWTMYWLDGIIPNEALANSRFVLAGTSGELRTALLGMAGTVLATAGVVFTLLTLPLSTVAAQYGSRLLRLFLGDRTAQFVLGMFVATFVYCMAAALSIPAIDVEIESPQLTATVGLYLMLATFTTLILLVQHISTMLQAPNIAASAGAELRDVVGAELSNDFTGRSERAISGAGQAGPV